MKQYTRFTLISDKFIRDNNKCHGLTHNVKDFSLKKTWQKIYPEIQRLKSNWELSVYLLELESAADQSKTEQNMCQDAWTLKPSHLKSRDSESPREYFATQVSMIDVLSRHKIHDRPSMEA
ncbi:hypothetical protein FPOAC2_10408 [Fusarium poae]